MEFLNQFTKRMKNVGLHAFIHKNSLQKTTWKNYGFDEWYEQVNMIFMVLLYVMEQTLCDAMCTVDHIGNFIDEVNRRYLKKPIAYEESKELGEFIINTILSDEGKTMYFNGFNFETENYEPIHISYIGNRITYIEGEVRRTHYFLTPEGYNLILSTLEVESNLRLTIQEMVFKMHLEKKSYLQAVDDVKTIFNDLRMKLQEIQEAMRRIRQNALSYSVEDYRKLQEDTLGALAATKKKYEGYKQVVKEEIDEVEKEHINIKKLDQKQNENLKNLQVIESYLSRAIEEQQKILNSHFDLKNLYDKELEGISEMTLIRRFDLGQALYEPMLKDVGALERIESFFRPLFNQELPQGYNINLAIQEQKLIRKKKDEQDDSFMSFEDELWQEERLKEKRKRLRQYKMSLKTVLKILIKEEKTTLMAISEQAKRDDALLEKMIPTVEIFREVMVELIKVRHIDIEVLRQEQAEMLEEETLEFQLTAMVLQLIDEEHTLKAIKRIKCDKAEEGDVITFKGLPSETGIISVVRCSNLIMEIGE